MELKNKNDSIKEELNSIEHEYQEFRSKISHYEKALDKVMTTNIYTNKIA